MFSSSELIHFVFANNDDDYYCGGLLRLNLTQYLWMKLHEEHYHAVYFLRKTGAQTFSVQTYGDKQSSPSASRQSWWKKVFASATDEEQQGDWLRRQLEKSWEKKAAFVCPIGDFCSLLSSEAWRDTLTSLADMRNRTGILVLTAPVTAEGSQTLLLTSHVFDRLKESAVTDARNSGERPLYPSIQNRKGDSMVFLNTFRREMIRDLLLRLSFEEGQILPQEHLDAAADYLTLYLNCSDLRKAEPLFDGGRLSWNFQYRELYDRLRNREVWTRLLRRSKQARQSGSLRNWQAEKPCGILRARDSYAERCLRLTVPETDTSVGVCKEILSVIQTTVRTPKNRLENPRIVAEIQALFPDLETAQINGDSDTYRRTLYAIQFCVQWVNADKQREADILQTIEKLKEIIRSSADHNWRRKQLASNQRILQKGDSLTEVWIQQETQRLTAWDRMLNQLEDAMKTSVLNLSLNAGSGDIQDLEKHLDAMLNEIDEQNQETEPKKPQPETDTEEEMYDFLDSVYDALPPD